MPPRTFAWSAFEAAVHRAVRSVPPGCVTTYGDVAFAIGRPKAGRAVGNVLRRAAEGLATPYHRVVRSDGRMGGYGDGDGRARVKRSRLRDEGIGVDVRGRIVDFAARRFAWPLR